jgi:hypothetical protein
MDPRRRLLESLVCAAQQQDGSVLRWGNSDVERYITRFGGQSTSLRHELANDFENRAGHTALAPEILRMIREGFPEGGPEEGLTSLAPEAGRWAKLRRRFLPSGWNQQISG